MTCADIAATTSSDSDGCRCDAMTMPSRVTIALPLTPTTSLSCLRILRTRGLPRHVERPRGEVLHDLPDALGAQRLAVEHGDREGARAGDRHAADVALDLGADEAAGVQATARLVGGVADGGG